MPRLASPAADALLDAPMKVLDDGFVMLIDYLGNDERIVSSARVSYGSGAKGTRSDAALIDYLLRHGHTSPFEQVVLTFHLRMPIFVARQWIRHRTARLNEVSARYTELREHCYEPALERYRQQALVNKQGSADELLEPAARARAGALVMETQAASYAAYRELLALGVARELARVVLPVGVYTEFYWQVDLHNLFHFLRLRLDGHAQEETRAFAQAVAVCARAVAPVAFAAFEEHQRGARRLGASEWALVREVVAADPDWEARVAASPLSPSRQRELLEALPTPSAADDRTQ